MSKLEYVQSYADTLSSSAFMDHQHASEMEVMYECTMILRSCCKGNDHEYLILAHRVMSRLGGVPTDIDLHGLKIAMADIAQSMASEERVLSVAREAGCTTVHVGAC